MDSISQPQNHDLKPKPKRLKKRLSQDQLRLLELSFNYEKKLEPERKAQLARDLGLPPRQVAIWYQNKRARWKAQSLELDYSALQLRLDSVFADKRRLEKEVSMLRAELQRAHEMLFVMNLTAAPISSGVTKSGNEDGTASYPEVANCNWEKSVEVLQVEELYACLMSTNDQSATQNVRNDHFAPPGS